MNEETGEIRDRHKPKLEPEFGFANALGALDKLKSYAEHFDKSFMKERTTA